MSDSHEPAVVHPISWFERASHQHWLEAEGERLLAFYRAARHPKGGFAALDDNGHLPKDAQPDTMQTARMTHCFSLATLRGEPGVKPLAQHGIDALKGILRDDKYGGWYGALPINKKTNSSKLAYIHAFITLSAASAWQAGIAGAREVLDDAINVINTHFWSEKEGLVHESFSRDWSKEEAYRGGNSNMHTTEAFLELADVLNEPHWRERALSIVTFIIHKHARKQGYRVVEHFDESWNEWPDYNKESPADPFRPYGATPGHSFEWARLILHLEAGLLAHGEDTPHWLLEDAEGLFHKAIEVGWNVDGEPGLIYSHDWDNKPIIRKRMHWTLAEATEAAYALFKRTGNPDYEAWYRTFWDYIDGYLIDREKGSWWQELDEKNQPSSEIWQGKADLYHAYQATLIPRLPLFPTIVKAISEGKDAL